MLLIYIHGYGILHCEEARKVARKIFKVLTQAGLSASSLNIILSSDIVDTPFIDIQRKLLHCTTHVPTSGIPSSYEIVKLLSEIAVSERLDIATEDTYYPSGNLRTLL